MQDPDFLFSVLAMIVKKSGGKIIISDAEMKDISKGDLIGMYYEPKSGDLILKQVEKEDMLKATSMVRDDVDKAYDNQLMYTYKAKLIRVIDGDTIEASVDLGFGLRYQMLIRLHGINTPETRTRNLKEKKRYF